MEVPNYEICTFNCAVMWQWGPGCHFASDPLLHSGMLGFIFVCYDNKVLWSAHTGKQDPISLLLTKPCVFSAKENWPQALHKPLLHILLSCFVHIVSIASIFIWGFHLLSLCNKHSSAPVVRAGSCRALQRADLHSTGFVIFPACGMGVGVVTDSGWEWGPEGGSTPPPAWSRASSGGRPSSPVFYTAKSWVGRLQGLPGSLLPPRLPSRGAFPSNAAWIPTCRELSLSSDIKNKVWLPPQVIPEAQRVEKWHSLFKNTLQEPALNLLFPRIFQIRKWLFALRVYKYFCMCHIYFSANLWKCSVSGRVGQYFKARVSQWRTGRRWEPWASIFNDMHIIPVLAAGTVSILSLSAGMRLF